MRFTSKILFTFVSLLSFSSCARQISSDHYVAGHVGEASFTYAGVIRSMREVYVEQSDQLDHNQTGLAGGGIAGGVLGNAIGKGRFLPSIAGAFAGALTGSLVEKKLKQQMAIEYVVEMEDGRLMTIVQGMKHPLGIGQPVYVIMSASGRSRITPQ